MEGELRRLRGLLGVGATWALAWGAIGALIGVAIGVLSPELVSGTVVEWALGLGAYGLVSGVGFGALLAYHERRKTIDELSPVRAGVLGLFGAVLVPLLFGLLGFFDAGTTTLDVLEAMAATGVLGATFASGSVAAARGAPRLGSAEITTALPPERAEEPALYERRPHAEKRR
jgi:hypothetical protein